MRRDGQEVRYRTEYILKKYHRLFQGVAIRDLQHNLDHYMVLGCLRGEPTKDLTDYLRKARRSSLCPPRQIMHYHTGNVYFDVVPNAHVLIFLTKK